MNGTTNNERILLVSLLNTMYNDNTRQIQNLNDSNNQIRNAIVSLLNSQIINTNRNNNNRNNNRNTNNNTNNRNTNANNRNVPTPMGRFAGYNNTSNSLSERYVNPNILYSYYSPFPSTNRQSIREDLTRTLGTFFDPIVINPTQTQIELATRNVRYCDIVRPINRSCPISLETFTDNDTVTEIRYCGHIFNTEQIRQWFTTSCRCPVCRYDIRNYNSSQTDTLAPPVERNEEERNVNTPVDRYLYSIITSSDISGNTSDTTAILSLITELQRTI